MGIITFAIFAFVLCVYFALFVVVMINLLKPLLDQFRAGRRNGLLDKTEGKADSFLPSIPGRSQRKS